MFGSEKLLMKRRMNMNALAQVNTASKINRRMIELARDAEQSPAFSETVTSWLALARKWSISNERPALRRSLCRVSDKISQVNCDCCGCRTTKAEALTMRHGEEIYLCPRCAAGNA